MVHKQAAAPASYLSRFTFDASDSSTTMLSDGQQQNTATAGAASNWDEQELAPRRLRIFHDIT